MKEETSIKFKIGGTGSHLVLLVCSLLFMINYMDRQVLSAVLEPMKVDLGLTDAQAGIIQTLFFMGMALFAFPASFLIDRWSRRKSVGLMAIIWSVFTFITGLGKSFIGVIIPRIMVGVGETGFSSGGIAMISASYPEKSRGRAIGIFYIAIPLGAALGVMLGGYISANHGGWRTPFFIFAVPGIMLGIAAFFLKDYKTVEETDEAGRKRGFLNSATTLFRIPTLKWIYIGIGMVNIMNFSILTWLPAYLMRSQGIGEDRAGMLMGVISLMALIGAPLGGFLADFWQRRNRRGRMYLPTLAVFISTALLIPSLMLEVQGLGFILAIIWGVLVILIMPPLGAVGQEVVSPGLKGMSVGMFNLCVYLLGGGWSPWLVGIISDSLGGGADGLKIALMLTTIGGIAAGILFWLSSRHYPRDMDRVKDIVLESEA
jgi:MFS family permease